MERWGRRVRIAALAGAVLAVAVVAVANAVVLLRSDDHVTDDLATVRPAQVAIVPGSLVRPDGTLGPVVRERLDAAVSLYDAGLVEKLLLSGDNGDASYDEPDAMRQAALDAGVAPQDVFTDYAGFNTWHTMRRARDVFRVDTAVVVTQQWYVARSTDLARAAGIEAQGLVVSDTGSGLREVLARVRGLGEATLRPEVTGGRSIPITGDGRESWDA
ncbi:SanA/YdcF family protein [Nocardioides litoris]|uniref:SanA/YdcF family protein n=1 Tax=Nocardioides litoris TaxID=1926648 RepID=UPI00111D6317|nr:ElyC/SanA/YdcF family protein [Nocardioides litoris]